MRMAWGLDGLVFAPSEGFGVGPRTRSGGGAGRVSGTSSRSSFDRSDPINDQGQPVAVMTWLLMNPVGVSPLAIWNALMAASVCGPTAASTMTFASSMVLPA